jgi:hypothetical protein
MPASSMHGWNHGQVLSRFVLLSVLFHAREDPVRLVEVNFSTFVVHPGSVHGVLLVSLIPVYGYDEFGEVAQAPTTRGVTDCCY